VLSGERAETYHDLVEELPVREEIRAELHRLRPDPSSYESAMSGVMRTVYDARLKLTGQNGISDYDVGFTNFLWSFARSPSARQDRALAAV